MPGEAANAWSAQDGVQTLVRADQGEALAQAQIGSQFALLALRGAAPSTPPAPGHDAGRIAHYFLERAAEQAQADVHALAGPAVCGGAGPTGDASDADADTSAMALMLIAKAAAHGHAIARQQLAASLPNVAQTCRICPLAARLKRLGSPGLLFSGPSLFYNPAMTFLDMLRDATARNHSLLCVGLDPNRPNSHPLARRCFQNF